MRKKMKRVAVMLAVIGLLVGSVHPKPARASMSDGEAALLAVGALTGYIVLIALVTAFAYRNRPCFPPTTTPSDIDIGEMPSEHGVRFGTHCTQTSPNATLICW